MDLYGCELWNIRSKYTEEMPNIWKLNSLTHAKDREITLSYSQQFDLE